MPNVTIVVDVLNGFCKQGNLASPRCDAAIPKIREVVEERTEADAAVSRVRAHRETIARARG